MRFLSPVLALVVGLIALSAPIASAQADDAAATRDDLLSVAQAVSYDPASTEAASALFNAWAAAHPDLAIVAAVSPAGPGQVSAFADFVVSKAKGTEVVPFAVADTTGGCAGGVIVIADGAGNVPTDFQPVDVTGVACNAQAAMAAYNAS